MTQPPGATLEGADPTPGADLAVADALARAQDPQITLVLGTFTADGLDVRRPQLTANLGQAIRLRAQDWVRRLAERTPVDHTVGYRADETDVAVFSVAANPIAARMKEKLFPALEVEQLHDSDFMRHAEFLAVVLARGDSSAALIKRITASKVVLKSDRKVLAWLGANQTLAEVESPILELDHSYHALVAGNHVFMASQEDGERMFGFEAAVGEKQVANARAIAAALPVSDAAAFERVCGNNRLYRKKLQSVVARGIFSLPATELAAFATAENLPIQFQVVGEQTVLVVEESRAWLRALMAFLDEDFVNGGLSGAKYLSNSKRKR